MCGNSTRNQIWQGVASGGEPFLHPFPPHFSPKGLDSLSLCKILEKFPNDPTPKYHPHLPTCTRIDGCNSSSLTLSWSPCRNPHWRSVEVKRRCRSLCAFHPRRPIAIVIRVRVRHPSFPVQIPACSLSTLTPGDPTLLSGSPAETLSGGPPFFTDSRITIRKLPRQGHSTSMLKEHSPPHSLIEFGCHHHTVAGRGA